jgi:hypothetical protein
MNGLTLTLRQAQGEQLILGHCPGLNGLPNKARERRDLSNKIFLNPNAVKLIIQLE